MRCFYLTAVISLMVSACTSVPPKELLEKELVSNMNPNVLVVSLSPQIGLEDVHFLRIAGVWMDLRNPRYVADFALQNVRIQNENFSAKFYFQSAYQLSCSFESDIIGTFINQVIEFSVKTKCGKLMLRPKINVKNWRGYYLIGEEGYGWYLVKEVLVVNK